MTEQPPEEGSRGERGPTGDTGPIGETGRDGAEGKAGPPGSASEERGPKGDHGQNGQPGEVGQTGATGVAGPSSRGRLIVMFVFVVLIFLMLSYLVQRNSDRIENNRLLQEYETCIERREMLTQFNTFVSDLAAVEEQGTNPDSPTYDKSAAPARIERVRIYKAAAIQLSDCSQIDQK